MKKLSLFAASLTVIALLSSCSSARSVLQRDIKYMQIRFKPLSRADITLVGNLQVESTISGKMSTKGKALDKQFANNLKRGLINKSESTEILYFAPGPGEAITGSLYENEVFNSVFGTSNLAGHRPGFFARLFPGLFGNKGARRRIVGGDPGMEFAYYAMVEKYPDVDYFINVRFDRKTILSGSKFTETVIVKADGVKLKTD
jgi:hypothetical protein